MEGNMTVFGFGRKYPGTERFLIETPQHFTVALRETRDFKTIRKFVRSLSKKPLK